MTRSSFAVGALGWIAPGLLAVPVAGTHEAAGGESALAAVIVWWALGIVGCFIAGAILGLRPIGAQPPAGRFWGGLAGVCLAWVAAVAVSVLIEATVKVLHMGPLTLLLPIPFVIGYLTGFGIGALVARARRI